MAGHRVHALEGGYVPRFRCIPAPRGGEGHLGLANCSRPPPTPHQKECPSGKKNEIHGKGPRLETDGGDTNWYLAPDPPTHEAPALHRGRQREARRRKANGGGQNVVNRRHCGLSLWSGDHLTSLGECTGGTKGKGARLEG